MKKMYRDILNAIMESFEPDGWNSGQNDDDSTAALSQNITVLTGTPFGNYILSDGSVHELGPDLVVWNTDDESIYAKGDEQLNDIPFKAIWVEQDRENSLIVHIHPLVKELIIKNLSLFFAYYNKFQPNSIKTSSAYSRITLTFYTYSQTFQKYTFFTESNSFSIPNLNISIKCSQNYSEYFGFQKNLIAFYGAQYTKVVKSWFIPDKPSIYIDFSDFNEAHRFDFILYDLTQNDNNKNIYTVKPSKKYKNIGYISNIDKPEKQDEETKEDIKFLETMKKRFENENSHNLSLLSFCPRQSYGWMHHLLKDVMLDDIPPKTKLDIAWLECSKADKIDSWEKILRLFINKDISADKCDFNFNFHDMPESFISEIVSKPKGKYGYSKNIFLGLLKNTNFKQAENFVLGLLSNSDSETQKIKNIVYSFFNSTEWPRDVNNTDELYRCVNVTAY